MRWGRPRLSTPNRRPSPAGRTALRRVRDWAGPAALLCAGCAPRGPGLPPLAPGAAGGVQLARILASEPCPPSLAADLKLTIEGGEIRPIRLTGSLRTAWPDRLRMQARAAAFWPVVSIAVAADSAFVSLPRVGGYWAGSLRGAAADHPAALASTLLQILCPGPLAGELEDPILDRSGATWILRGRFGPEGSEGWLEFHGRGGSAAVETLVLRDGNGAVTFQAERLGSQSVGPARVPEAIRIRTEDPPIRFEARIFRARSDPAAPADLFRIDRPPGARWIEERELLRGLEF